MAVNNLISVKGPKDVSDGLRKFDRLKDKEIQKFQLARGLDLKLSRNQREAIYSNRILLLLHANKMDQVVPLALLSTFCFFIFFEIKIFVELLLLFLTLQRLKTIGSRACCCTSRNVS